MRRIGKKKGKRERFHSFPWPALQRASSFYVRDTSHQTKMSAVFLMERCVLLDVA